MQWKMSYLRNENINFIDICTQCKTTIETGVGIVEICGLFEAATLKAKILPLRHRLHFTD